MDYTADLRGVRQAGIRTRNGRNCSIWSLSAGEGRIADRKCQDGDWMAGTTREDGTINGHACTSWEEGVDYS